MPPALAGRVRVGTTVRVDLHGRRVGGWVVALGVDPPPGVRLRPLAKVTGEGPAPEVLDLARWAAWRWAGRTATFCITASPRRAVTALPVPVTASTASTAGRGAPPEDPLAAEALAHPRAVLRLPPAADPLPVVLAAAARGTTLVVCPSVAAARETARRARAAGVDSALLPDGWAAAAAGTRLVVGARAAAWGPARHLGAVVVLDEHDEGLQAEGSPTWHARGVAAERARRAGVPCVLLSPCPSLEALAAGRLVRPSRADERAGWPVVEVVDRRRDDPLRSDLYSRRLVDLVRGAAGAGPVVCVLNRRGRGRLLACAACAELARCDRCGAAVEQGEGSLRCRRCRAERPVVCAPCGATRLKVRRIGVTRAREDLERLAGVPVAEVTGDLGPGAPTPDAAVVVGTEAVLHRVRRAAVVAFLDLDQELLTPRYRAAEQALALIARAARLVGGRAGGGRLLLQTRLPGHEVVVAAVRADPGVVAGVEAERRAALGYPPITALAEVGGPAAPAFVDRLPDVLGLQVRGPVDGRWLLRAPDHQTLCDALAATPRPPGRLRLAVDPPRV